MIFAAGEGIRLQPLTRYRAKAALPFLHVPLIAHQCAALAAAGVTEAVINLHAHPASVRRALEGQAAGLAIHWSEEASLLGTGGGLARVRERFRGESEFLLVNADTLREGDLAAAVRFHRESGAVATLGVGGPAPSPATGVRVAGDRITGFRGEPKEGEGEWHTFTGVQVGSPDLLAALPDPVEPGDIIDQAYRQLLADGVTLVACRTEAYWSDLGTPADYLAAVGRALDQRGQRHLVAPGARVAEGVSMQRVVVETLADVRTRVRLTDAVVLEEARIGADCRLERVVVGEGVHLPPGAALKDRVVFRDVTGWRSLPLRGSGGSGA